MCMVLELFLPSDKKRIWAVCVVCNIQFLFCFVFLKTCALGWWFPLGKNDAAYHSEAHEHPENDHDVDAESGSHRSEQSRDDGEKHPEPQHVLSSVPTSAMRAHRHNGLIAFQVFRLSPNPSRTIYSPPRQPPSRYLRDDVAIEERAEDPTLCQLVPVELSLSSKKSEPRLHLNQGTCVHEMKCSTHRV